EVAELELTGWDATIDPADATADLILAESRRAAAEEESMHLRGRPRRLREPDKGTNPAGQQPPTPPPAPPPPTPTPIVDSGLGADDRARLDRLAESERRTQVGQAIDAALEGTPYNSAIRQQIADAVRGQDLPNTDAVPAAVER